ncbi:protease inhibitor I42 family protein [Methanocorpusculum vombati]|uniref:Protease inhibitor I42 family protein n=1 Tax=Methanocorpusculum vombati TaxID=3002864 RepID=A0ABT4IP57_9EURY|nr:protease inhibitor I42 family protein [Methanocorpusculum vombati]MCZ9319293.1 protease inhibitor I42 family protein [Methanocorpusculum sp.]MCZ0863546.1 protease inhibitor I42 family protein [Methanocorpusculum vombati]MDE2520966.1 protease inhibitor I42 family protein [Methanocorpusculum sp.]MDE2533591.1 protease inhibitor I42 family protein [Methanocorpusculum sp.]MDE2548493.1 protease inhibitor I42 family protein [Methanocorpusculum sp.]
MARLGIAVFVLIAVAVCIFSAGCIGTDTPATPTPTATPAATVVPTQEPTKLPDNMTPVTTITVEKYGVAVPAGNMIRYLVPSNPTTGYQWFADNVTGLVINQTYEAAPETAGLAGAGGNEIFTITADKAGTYQFVANYQRAWEDKIPEATLNQTLVFSNGTKTETTDPLLSVTFEGIVSPAAGETVKITTEGNPTTGYQWTAVPGLSATKSDNLVILNATYVPTPVADGIVGSGGTYEWLVTAEKPGTYEFRAQYKRSWEDEPAGEFFFTITFR